MTDLLQTASEWLAGKLADHAAQPIDYLRGDARLPLVATIGVTSRQVDRGDGLIVEAESIDFLFRAADLVIDGEQTEPRPGDRIELRLRAAERRTYEVASPGGSDPCWEPSDRYGVRIRVHTKLIEVER